MQLMRRRPWRRVPARASAGPLRCLFVITSMPVGGAETLLVNLVRRLDRQQFAPEIVCLKQAGPLGEMISAELPLHSNLLRSKWDLRVLPRLMWLLHRRRADVVITVGAGDKMFWGRLAAFLVGVPGIASALHSTGWPDSVGRLNRWLSGITDTFIATAENHARHLRQQERFPADRVRVIRNGVDCERYTPNDQAREDVRCELGIPADAILVGVVAALRPEKNLKMFVHAAHVLRDNFPEAHWVIIGDGPQRAMLETEIERLAMQQRVHLLGMRDDTPRLVAAMDLFTLCSLNEASPVSILEALACGVPVVATDVGSVGESVIDGTTGRLVPSEDLPALTAAVEHLLADREARVAMGRAGRELVQRRGSLQSMVEGYQRMMIELYDQRVTSTARMTAPKGQTRMTKVD